MKGSHETTHKQTLQFRMQSQADTQLQQQLQGILRHTCHIHWHTCLNSFGSHAALVAAISNLCFVTHFEFVTVDVDQNMVTKRPYKLVSWVEFECVLHHFSSPTRWNGSRGQVRSETCQGSEICHDGGLGGYGPKRSLQKVGGRSSPLFGMASGTPGAAPIPRMTRFRPLKFPKQFCSHV